MCLHECDAYLHVCTCTLYAIIFLHVNVPELFCINERICQLGMYMYNVLV